MPAFSRDRFWRFGIALFLLAGLTVGVALFRNVPSEAYPGMPEDQRTYWSWVSSINRDPSSAVAGGVDLLRSHAHLPALYLKLADACRGRDIAPACRDALTAVHPPDALTALYREAALTRLMNADTTAPVIEAWKRIAGDPALDPTLARLVVDHARAYPEHNYLPEVEAVWQGLLAHDSSAAGAAFGAGYAAVLRNEWGQAERLLEHVTTLRPDDPQAYRELGRIYFMTSQPEPFESALEAGIEAAHRRHDLEQALIMRGNLGLAMMEWKGDYERAGALFEEAIRQCRLLADERTEGFNMYRLASVRINQNRYQDALTLLDSAAVRFAEYAPAQRPEVIAQRGHTLAQMFRFTEAETVLEEAIREADTYRNLAARLQALVYLARLRYDMGQYTPALDTALDVLNMATEYGVTDFQILARGVLGDAERETGNYESAATHYQKGLALAKETQNVARARVLYEKLGILALLARDTNAAHAYFERMLASLDQEQSSRNLVLAYLGLGYTYDQFGNYTEAVRLYDLALSELSENMEPKLQIELLQSKATSLLELGAFDEALALLQEAQQLARDQENIQSEYKVEGMLGGAYLKRGHYGAALRRFLRAEELEDELQWSSVHWNVLYGKAVAYWKLGKNREAERAFREAISIIETLRDNINSTEGRAFFVQDKVQVYKDFSAFLEDQGRSEEAFHFNERARSRSLVDLLYTTQQGRRLDLDNLADQAIELNRRMRALEHEVEIERASAEEAASYRSNRAAYLRRERMRADSLYRRVEIDLYGENQIYTFNPLQADSVRAMLKEDEALIVYNLRTLFAEPSAENASVAYVVLPGRVYVQELHFDNQELAETVRFFRDQVSDSNQGPGDDWEPAARRLYADLIEPLLPVLPKSVRHLNIVPEGILHYLPFAALQDPQGDFLVERFTLSVVPSATILKLCREKNPGRWSYMLLMADPDGRLPGARKEVMSIAAGATNRRHVLVGKDATQDMFEDVANRYDIIHFATHGNFISRAPWRSHLELYGDILSVEEIGHLRLDAYLVTLSACETALSSGLSADVPDGDEWVGLNQAFLAAGTPTVMASLWSIDDRVSSTFMAGFYDELGPEGKAQALATMQRHFIDSPGTRHPFYWAAFTIIGDPL